MHHRLLQRQLRRTLGADAVPDAGWAKFLELISDYYAEVDRDRNLSENALAVNSEELEALYAQLRRRADAEQALLRSFTNSIPDLFFAKSPEGLYLGCNSEFERFVGRPEKEIIGHRVNDLLSAAQAADITIIDQQVLASGRPHSREEWLKDPAGQMRCIEMLRAPYYGADGTLIGLLGIGRDVTERRRLEEQNRLAAQVYRHTGEGMLVTDAEFRILDINPAGMRITGYSLEDVRGRTPEMFNSGRQDRAFYDSMRRTIAEIGYWNGEIWDRRQDGEVHAKSVVVNRLDEEDGSVHGHVMFFSDITQKKQADDLIWRQANFDMLTGLPNRRMLRERLEHEIRQADRARCSMALLLIDLDHFKEINDTLGHLIGDDLLVEAARRISACTRETDTVARLGGDEFTTILTRVNDTRHVEAISQKILDRLAEPFQLGDSVVYVSASLGITLYPQDATEVEDLLKSADQAMYVAKRQGRNRFSHFTQGLQTAAQDRLRTIGELREAVWQKQFHLHFQPIVDTVSGQIRKAEALLRWDHPVRGVVPPAEFIALAEETGLIAQLGDWVFREATRWAARWATVVPGFQVSVNVSPVQFRTEDAAARAVWIEQMRAAGAPAGSMVIEITEGVLLSADMDAAAALRDFRAAGIQIAIDDFGTGYSSLGYLNRFDIDFLKIDKSFVQSVATDAGNGALCEAIVVMAHKLGLRVIAEGVETQEQADRLMRAGSDFAQGYLYSRPIPPEQLEAILRHGAHGR